MSQSWARLMESIESEEFAFQVNLASGLRHFRRLARRSEASQALIEEMRKDPSIATRVAQRTIELTRERSDARYEHQLDAAVGVYLLALEATPSGWARLAATQAHRMERGWWAPKIAEAIINSTSSLEATAGDLVIPGIGGAFTVIDSHTSDALSYEATLPAISTFYVQLKARSVTSASGVTRERVLSPSLETYLVDRVRTVGSETNTVKAEM